MESQPTPSCSKKPEKGNLQKLRNKITGPRLYEQIRAVVNKAIVDNALKKQTLDIVDIAINFVQILKFEKHNAAKELQKSIADQLSQMVQEGSPQLQIVSVIEENMESLCKVAGDIDNISISRFKWLFEKWEKLKCLLEQDNKVSESPETPTREDSSPVPTPVVPEDTKIPDAPAFSPIDTVDSLLSVPFPELLPNPVQENASLQAVPEQMIFYPYSIIDCRECEECKNAFKISETTKEKTLSPDLTKCELSEKTKCEERKRKKKKLKKEETKRKKVRGEIANENESSVSKPMEIQTPILGKEDGPLEMRDDSLLNHTLLLRKFSLEVENAWSVEKSLMFQVSFGSIACGTLEKMPQLVYPKLPDNFPSLLISCLKSVHGKSKRFYANTGVSKALRRSAECQKLRCDVRSYETCNEGMLLNAISKILDFNNIDIDKDALDLFKGATVIFLRMLTTQLQRNSYLWYIEGPTHVPSLIKELEVFPMEPIEQTLKCFGINGIGSILLHVENVFETHREVFKKSRRDFKRFQEYHRRVKLFFKKLEDFGSTLQINDIELLKNEFMKEERRSESLNNEEPPNLVLKKLQNVMKKCKKRVLAFRRNQRVEQEQQTASLEEHIASEE